MHKQIVLVPEHHFQTLIRWCPETVKFFQGKFICQRCGKCCNGDIFPMVHLYPGEAQELAQRLALSTNVFTDRYCSVKDFVPYLRQPCPFLDETGESSHCRAYGDRPKPCRSFPLISLPGKPVATVGIDIRCPAGRELQKLFLAQLHKKGKKEGWGIPHT
jgi:Fe-S-cluster containining protein